MQIELLGAINYADIEKELQNRGIEDFEEIVEYIKQLEKERRAQKVAAAGMISRSQNDALGMIDERSHKSFKGNTKIAGNILGYGHASISEHDFVTFALKDVSVMIEQTIIEERHSAFTIKSRREVNVAKDGYYIPDFHDKDGNIHPQNEELKKLYTENEDNLFAIYDKLIQAGVPKEDARFLLPYSFHANIFMTIDVHTLRDMIIKYTKTHYSKIPEIKEFGEKLYEIAKEHVPYIIPGIDAVPYQDTDKVRDFIENVREPENYEVIKEPRLLNCTLNVDDTILVSALMRRYQYTKEQAEKVLKELEHDYYVETGKDNFKEELMRKIVFEGDKKELHQVNFQFQLPFSYAVLTHITRHRTHHLLIPDFAPTIDLENYITPESITRENSEKFDKAFENNRELYHLLKDKYGISDEELTPFVMSGNTLNIVTNMDGWTLEHICRLRECNKAQWQIRDIMTDAHERITEVANEIGAEIFTSLLGPTCKTLGKCFEGKDACPAGKILQLQQEGNKASE